MLKRVIKIFPLYWSLTITTYIFMRLVPQVFPYEPTFTELIKSMFLIPFSHQSTATSDALYPIVSMGHTIQTTMLYYLLFWIASTISHHNRGLITTILIVVIVVFGILFKPSSSFLKFYLKSDLIYFVAGIGAYYFCKHMICAGKDRCSISLVLFFVLFTLSMLIHNRWLLLILIFLLMCCTVISRQTKALETTAFKKIATMGNWTFSYFLIHLYCLRFIEVFGGTEFSIKTVAFDIIALATAWGISYLLYEFIEKRFTNQIRKLLLY